ncbi:tRNA(adenine34) deaminase [Sinobacterium caligoides]|uniref:tRNA-specific adenosine deaminase n=1 Tax=Sinobacterium caligoides TaxID=933926 RepID=A0A3N2E0T7_9GAMM|nr:tRNA adenosine(34) deaminase TadA [Sinobacterium caligoides]ROS05185.1 tRNA(adenine34) deaminase [Sinobacterium caligoides]
MTVEIGDELTQQAAEDQRWMTYALALAAQAAERGEVPVGAVVVQSGRVIGEGSNSPIGSCDPTAHAEVVALRQAAANTGNYRLPGATLYVTIEPCTMCSGAIIHSRIACLVYGALEPKAGVVVSQAKLLQSSYINHRLEVRGGIMAKESAELVSRFFRHRREAKKALKLKLRGDTPQR